jgi:two-component system response regulator YesN
VLIAEDEPREAEALRLLLLKYYPEHVGEVAVAGNGDDAVRAARDFRPDVVFMDIHMPGLNGLNAGREIRAGDDEVEIIMVTAYADFDYARQAIANRILHYLVKPYSVKTLREAFDQAVIRMEKAGRLRRSRESSRRLAGLLEREFLHKIMVNFRLREDIILRHARMLGVDSHCYRLFFFEIGGEAPPDAGACEDLFSRLRQAGIGFMHSLFKNTLCILPHASAEEALGKPLDRIVHGFADGYPGMSFFSSEAQSQWEKLAVIYRRTFGRFIGPGGRGGGGPSAAELETRLANAVVARDDGAICALARALVDRAFQKYGTSNDFGFTVMTALRNILRAVSLPEDGMDDWIDGNFRIPYRGDREQALDDLTAGIEMIMVALANNTLGRSAQVVRRVKRHLEEHYRDAVSLDRLAALVGMSKFHLSRTFRNLENETIIGHLQRLRIGKAKLLLSQGESVAEACRHCGFSDPAYFGRIFKKLVGVPPAVFSRRKRG